MSASLYANGGLLLKELKVPDYTNYRVDIVRGKTYSEDMRVLGSYLRDVIKLLKSLDQMRPYLIGLIMFLRLRTENGMLKL